MSGKQLDLDSLDEAGGNTRREMNRPDGFEERQEAIKPPKPHLRRSPQGWGNENTANGEYEWWCDECRSRITISPNDDSREYGHRRDCDHCFTDELRSWK